MTQAMPNFQKILLDCERRFRRRIEPSELQLYIGKLATYAKETAEELGWFEQMPEAYFNAEKFATNLVEDGQAISIYDLSNDVNNENGVWVLNPDDFTAEADNADEDEY